MPEGLLGSEGSSSSASGNSVPSSIPVVATRRSIGFRTGCNIECDGIVDICLRRPRRLLRRRRLVVDTVLDFSLRTRLSHSTRLEGVFLSELELYDEVCEGLAILRDGRQSG